MITAQQLQDGIGIDAAHAAIWEPKLNEAMDLFEVNTPERAAAFLAQVAWESNKFTALEENLNYSEAGLAMYFSKHFDNEEEMVRYAHKPEAIANRVYANRHGNGNENTGDGWRYRGGGLVQLTFKDNYKAFGDALGDDFVTDPSPVRTPQYAALVAGWYWKTHGCNELADLGDFTGITKAINGGLNGLDKRTALWEAMKEQLCGNS